MIRPQRVVVTGIGVVAPNGIGKDAFWDSLLSGKTGIGYITLFDALNTPCKIAGEVKNFIPARFIDSAMKPHRMARSTQFAVAAARMALEDAQLSSDFLATIEDLPLILGVSTSAPDMWERHRLQIDKRGPANGPPYIIGAFMPHAAVNAISSCLKLKTCPMTLSSACVAGMDAICLAAGLIQAGRADLAIAGGSDAPITYTSLTSFAACGLISSCDQDPSKASRPFDRNRESGVVSEGAGVVVLENLHHALARGVEPYLEITGYAINADRDPQRPGAGLADTMRQALANAGCRADTVDYVNAQGPGDLVLDRIEVEEIKKVLGKRAYEIPVTSIKGNTGNPLAAGGPHQMAACALVFRHNLIPPVANLEDPDPDCDLDFVAGRPRAAHLECALINNHGMGGRNCTVVVQRVNGL